MAIPIESALSKYTLYDRIFKLSIDNKDAHFYRSVKNWLGVKITALSHAETTEKQYTVHHNSAKPYPYKRALRRAFSQRYEATLSFSDGYMSGKEWSRFQSVYDNCKNKRFVLRYDCAEDCGSYALFLENPALNEPSFSGLLNDSGIFTQSAALDVSHVRMISELHLEPQSILDTSYTGASENVSSFVCACRDDVCGDLFFAVQGGLVQYDTHTKSYRQYDFSAIIGTQTPNRIFAFDDLVFILVGSDLYRVQGYTLVSVNNPLGTNLFTILRDNYNFFWMVGNDLTLYKGIGLVNMYLFPHTVTGEILVSVNVADTGMVLFTQSGKVYEINKWPGLRHVATLSLNIIRTHYLGRGLFLVATDDGSLYEYFIGEQPFLYSRFSSNVALIHGHYERHFVVLENRQVYMRDYINLDLQHIFTGKYGIPKIFSCPEKGDLPFPGDNNFLLLDNQYVYNLSSC